jgi:hypothetical protein
MPQEHSPHEGTRPALPRAVTFEATRDAVRQLLAVRAGHLAGAQGVATALLRQQVLELGAQLRWLQEQDEEGLAQVRRRCAEGLAAADARLPGADARRDALAPEESTRIFEELIAPALLDGCVPARQPEAILIGSHLGCGTAQAMAVACASLGGPRVAALLLLDDLRAFDPHYADLMRQDLKLAAYYTESDALRWLDMALRDAVRRRISLVLEPAMRSADAVALAFGALRAGGYRIEARALAVPHAASWQAILSVQELGRLECGISRPVTSAAHQATYDGLPLMLDRIERDRLADRATVYDAHGECRYSQELGSHRRNAPEKAVNVLRVLRALPPSLEELRAARETFAWLERLTCAPQRSAGAEEVLRMEGHRWDAECALLAHAFLTIPEPECLQEFPQLAPAFGILRNVRASAASLPPDEGRLLLKRAAEGIARRISHGNLTVPAPWLPTPAWGGGSG